MNFQELHNQAISVARNYLRAEAELLSLFQLIDACKGFRNFGYTSLFSYAVKELKLSESTALNLINVARKSVQVPALKIEIEKGNLSLCKARKIASVLNTENQNEWIEKAKTLTTRGLEKEIAKVAPGLETAERVRYVTDYRMNMNLNISETTFDKLKHIQDLESQKKGRPVSLEETIDAITVFYIEKKDPLEKAKRVLARKNKSSSIRPNCSDVTRHTDKVVNELNSAKDVIPVSDGVDRKPISRKTLNKIVLRDQAQCTAVDNNGKRCLNKRWVHFHHIKPVSQGGSNELENITTLCSAHHQMHHRQLNKYAS